MSTEGDPPEGPPGSPDSTQELPAAEEAPASKVEPVGPQESTADLAKPATTSAFLDAAPATEDSILPTSLDPAADLDAAVGARRKRPRLDLPPDDLIDDDGLPDESKWSRKTIAVIALAIVIGLGIAALVLLGRNNSQRFVLNCTTSQAVAEQGRSFPPWGSVPLPGAEWRPIALPPSAQCKRQEVDDKSQLEALFLDLLLDRSSTTLTARNFLEAPPVVDGKATASPLDLVSNQLEQALLLSRAPERGDQRKQVVRLQGDVQYWRASLRLRDATAAMTEASRQFDQAALARPMHVSDAGAWAELIRRLSDELKAGPTGVPAAFPPAPTGERPSAPTGTALPVEPTSTGSAAEPPPAMPAAGVPTGGVLL